MKATLLSLLKKTITHELITGSFFIFTGTLLANVLAFLFNLLLARKLSYVEYGEYAAIVSLFSLFIIPSTSAGNIIIKFATEFFTKKEFNKLTTFFYSSTNVVGVFGILIVLVLLLFQGVLKDFLHLPNTVYMLFLGGMILVSYMSMVNASFIQSMLRFNVVAVILVVGALGKLILGTAFIFLGMKVFGVFTAILLSGVIAYLVSFYPLVPRIFSKHEKVSIRVTTILTYALPATITLLALSFFISTDVLLVKHFFSGKDAGVYSGLSLIGRIIFYFTGPIPGVMFPLIIKRLHKGENITNLFSLALLLVLLPGLAITCFYYIFPIFVINFFLGGKGYVVSASYVGLIGLFITIYSVLNILVSFFLSTGKTNIVYVLVVGALLQATLIWFFHASFGQVIYDSIFSSLVVLVTLLLYYGKTYVNFGPFKKTVSVAHNPSI